MLLAGLISETQNSTHSGIPVARSDSRSSATPSRTKDKSIARTELIMFIRPQIIHDGADASVVAEELRSKMRGGQVGSLGVPNFFAPNPNRDMQ